MTKRTLTALTLSAALMGAILPTATHSQSVVAAQALSDIPLIVIRYNQSRVYYDKQLYNAASKALRIKPDARFSVVSFIPELSRRSARKRAEEQAQRQTAKLVADMRNLGIPAESIHVTREATPGAAHHEVYIYVD